MSGIDNNLFVRFDRASDYIPLVSTATNLLFLFQKYVLFNYTESFFSQDYRNYLQEKPTTLSIVLLIPVIGNIFAAIYNRKTIRSDENSNTESSTAPIDYRARVNEWVENGSGNLEHRKAAQREILNFFNDQNKNHLVFRNLDIENLPDIFSDTSCVERLESLKIDHCKLKAIPDTIGNCTALKFFHCEYCNSLTALPDTIGNCTALKRFRCWYCTSLTTLPKSIGNWKALKSFDCTGCTSLRALPDSIGDWTALTFFYCDFCNSLTVLPESIGNWTALTNLNLFHCQGLTALNSLMKLSNRCTVNLQGCKFSEAVMTRLREATNAPGCPGPRFI
jgi:Leucine-rich repeat (LRR) protein